MLTAFYIFVAAMTAFVILSLAIVRNHEKAASRRAEEPEEKRLPEEEFFDSPIYKAMEFIAHM